MADDTPNGVTTPPAPSTPRKRAGRTALPDGWQVAHRPGGVYLQERQLDGSWIDRAGPYGQRSHAVEWLRRHLAAF